MTMMGDSMDGEEVFVTGRGYGNGKSFSARRAALTQALGDPFEGLAPVPGVAYTAISDMPGAVFATSGGEWEDGCDRPAVDQRACADDCPGMRYRAYVSDPIPVPGAYSSIEDALEAARAELPEGNAVGHVVEVEIPGSRRHRLYCLTASGDWCEVVR